MKEPTGSKRVMSPRFNIALTYAAEAHSAQLRKGTSTPYVSHLLAVCSIVLENQGTETEAIAALLHDAVEDCGGLPRLADIRTNFGDEVADLVAACSDSTSENSDEKRPWRERKEAHLAKLDRASSSIALIYAADKLHNARCIVSDLRQFGEATWQKFKGGREGTLWYYGAVLEKLRGKTQDKLIHELGRVIQEMELKPGGLFYSAGDE